MVIMFYYIKIIKTIALKFDKFHISNRFLYSCVLCKMKTIYLNIINFIVFLTLSIQLIFLYELDVFLSGSEWKGSFSGENNEII